MQSLFRNPFRNKREFKLGWRDTYPRVVLPGQAEDGRPTERELAEQQAWQASLRRDFPTNFISTTKYSLFSYLPKALFYEFKKFTSVYFLVVAVICFVPSVAPFSPWSSVGGLLFIVAVSMIREAVEDWFRLRADQRANSSLFRVLPRPLPRQYSLRSTSSSSSSSVSSSSSSTSTSLLWSAQRVGRLCERGVFQQVASEDVRVGDIIIVQADETIPADILLLASGGDNAAAYMETAQLDGETNLKLRRALPATQALGLDELSRLRGSIQVVGGPVAPIYQFEGNLTLHRDCVRAVHLPMRDVAIADGDNNDDDYVTFPVDHTSMLLRGCILRNTPWLCGVVVFAGSETKLMLNARDPPSKFSSLDYRINKYVLYIFVFQMLLCVWMAGITTFFQRTGASFAWYLGAIADQGAAVAGVTTFFTYFALTSYLIPISLVVTVEISKVVQGKFMEWDAHMMTYNAQDDAWEGMTVKTFNLNDDLGTIEYIFSDKTGTLTCNEMRFRKCAVPGLETFHRADQGLLATRYESLLERSRGASPADPCHAQLDRLHMFLVCLSLAHSCVVADKGRTADDNDDDDDDDDYEPALAAAVTPTRTTVPRMACEYRSASPDEEALVEGAASNRFVYRGRSGNVAELEIFGDVQQFEVLYEMEFTSARRRMSVVVRTPQGRVLLLSKGADAEMKRRLHAGAALDFIDNHLELFSGDGLRTLVLCWRELNAAQLNDFAEAYYQASTALQHRDEAVEAVCDRLERELLPLGCTGIEDRLQDGVPECISYLLQAGIHIWMITGDKQATAISIGYSTKLLDASMAVEKINATSADECRDRLDQLIGVYVGIVAPGTASSKSGAYANVSERELAMVIDGDTLSIVLEQFADRFFVLAAVCHSVICCRVSALQKAEVVKLVKTRCPSICLAVGDGANDVGMIQEAHIGIGIFGREGSEAARSSDYAIREFRHLKRLLCVHGRYALIRNAGTSLYSFYKNAAIFLSQVWFSFFSVASAQSLYNEWVMTFFNIIFTSWPPLIYGCVEKDIDERIIERYPETYRRTQQNTVFTVSRLTEWLLFAIYHSVVLYFGSQALVLWPASVMTNGQAIGLTTFGQMVLNAGIPVIFLKLIMETLEWNWVVHLSMWGSLLLYPLLVIVETVWIGAFPEQYWVLFNLVQYTPVYWLWFIAAIVVCLLPDFMLLVCRNYFFPEDWLLLREYYRYHPQELDYPVRPSIFRFPTEQEDPTVTSPGDDATPLLSPYRPAYGSFSAAETTPAKSSDYVTRERDTPAGRYAHLLDEDSDV